MISVEITSNSNIKVFENPEFGSISIIEIDNEWMFELYAVGAALGYVRSNGKSKGEHGVHPENEKLFPYKSRIDKVAENAEIKPCVYYGNKYITESQVYDLMLEARTDKCRTFRKWVTSEVLPSIRKTGAYITQGSDTEQYISNLQNTVTELSLQLVEIHKELRILSGKKQIDMKIVNIWKKQIANHRMEIISEHSGIDIKDCYKMVYDIMADDYGFCEAAVINDFVQKYECDKVSTITIIAADKLYRQWFVQATDKLIDNLTPALLEKALSDFNAEEMPEKKFPDRFADGTISVQDHYDDIIDYVAYLRGDNTKTKIATKRYIFPMMASNKGWKIALTRHRCATKKALILNYAKYKKRFVKVCNEIILKAKASVQ